MFGTHSMVPAFLINQHQISNVKEANDYIARLNGVPGVFDQLITGLEIRADKNIIAPKFVFPHVIDSSKNIIKGAPFEQGEDSTLLADFKRKVNALEIDQAEKDALISKATEALKTAVKPAYSKLINYIAQLEKRADDRDGAWKFPNGEAFYNNALKRTTTTDLTAKEIHAIGLAEVSRIHDEMRAIKDKVGFEGDLNAFMQFMKTDKQFYLANTEAGKAQYLSEAKGLIDNMKTRLDELFVVKPKADMIVKRVEAFREKAAGKAFYQQPAPDGSRPGIYYANLYDMEAMPTYQMEALAYHEGIPGHHMQIAISQDGEISVSIRGQAEPQVLGQMNLSDFINPTGLQPIGQNLYVETASSGAPIQGVPGLQGIGTIAQGTLETSNVNVTEELVNLIESQRLYEMNSKVISSVDQMLGQVIQQL